MKLFTRFLSLSVLLVAAALVINIQPGSAIPADETGTNESTECFQEWDGEVLLSEKNKAKIKKFEDSKCRKKGPCTTKEVRDGGQKAIKISCETPEAYSDDEGASGSSSGPDGFTDQAVNAATCNKNGCELLAKYLNPFIKLLSYIVGIAVVIGIMIGAIQVITSAGDAQKNANGKNHIRNALIAAVAYVILFAFLQWVIPGGVT